MTIYPLPPEELDDNTLKKQIKAIAQTLSNIHYLVSFIKKEHKIFDFAPLLPPKFTHNLYSLWGKLCRANYLKLVDMGMACCEEYAIRFSDYNFIGNEPELKTCWTADNPTIKKHKLQSVIEWARDNVPDLPTCLNYSYCQPQKYYPVNGWMDYESNKFISCHESHEPTPFPLVMPDKYSKELTYLGNDDLIIQAYRNYYRAKLKKKIIILDLESQSGLAIQEQQLPITAKWTRREKPEWLQS